MKPVFREPICITFIIVLHLLSVTNSVETNVIDSNDNRNYNRSTIDDKLNEIVFNSIDEFNQPQILKEISEKEKFVEELVLRFPDLSSVLPTLKFDGYQIDSGISTSNNPNCVVDLQNLVSSLSEKWALPLFDSYGKPPSGILKGDTYWTGNYDQCLSFEAPKSKLFRSGFKGRYCVATIKLQNISTSIRTAICVPNSCDSVDLRKDLSNIVKSSLSRIPIVNNLVKVFPDIQMINCLPENPPLNNASIAFIVVVSIVTVLILTGTGYDAYVRYNPYSKSISDNGKSTEELTNGETAFSINSQPINVEQRTIVGRKKTWIGEFTMCFSLLKNGESLLDTTVKPGQLNCVHGIKFISMTWIILSHTCYFGLAQFGNFTDFVDKFNNWPFLGIIGGQFAVDTFFFLSGFLLSYLFLKDKNTFTLKKLGPLYAHRYIRLTPVYMMVVFAFGTLFNFIGDGPYWPYLGQENNICTQYWWINMLYLNYIFKPNQRCLGWSWYLANDMIYFIISPLFLVFMKSQIRKWRYVGLGILFALLLTTWIATIIIVVIEKISADLNFQSLSAGDMLGKIYNKPWLRMGPYLIGCLLGYVMVRYKGLTRVWSLVLWGLAIALGLVVVYGLFKAELSITTSAFYYGLSRTAWSVAVAWVVFACVNGHGGPVDKFLSWKFFFPLSRLTYCAYLVHPIVILYYFMSLRNPIMVTNNYIAIHYLGFTVLSYGLALVTSLAFESPIIRLEKLLREGVRS